jgi:hypothetical protein
VTSLLRRGLLTKKELDESFEMVKSQAQEAVEQQDDATKEAIPVRKKPQCHGDSGIVEK